MKRGEEEAKAERVLGFRVKGLEGGSNHVAKIVLLIRPQGCPGKRIELLHF